MNTPIEASEGENILMFGEKPVRITMFDGIPYFSLEDVCEASNWSPIVTLKAGTRFFPTHGKRTVEENSESGLREATFLSPVGVWYFTDLVDAGQGQKISAWAKKESWRLCPEPPAGDPAMFLTLAADFSLPPRPLKYSGRRSEWYDLKDSDTYLNRPRRSSVSEMERGEQLSAILAVTQSAASEIGAN